jgi:cytochrome P450 family 110
MTPTPPNSSLGYLHAISAATDPARYFRRHAAHPHPFQLKFPGMGNVIFFATTPATHDILTMAPPHSHPPTPNPIEPIVGKRSLILLSGEDHGRERRLLTPAFHGERIKSYVDIIASATTEEIGSRRPGHAVAVRELAVAIALNVAIRVVFGVADPSRRQEYTHAVKALMRANTAPLMLVPALRRNIGGRGPWARLLRLRDQLDQLLSEDIEDRKRKGLLAGDMLDVLLFATDEHGQPHSEQDMHDQLRTLLAAGHETTATSLMWSLYHIYRDDSVRERLVAELSGRPTPLEMTTLPYLNAVVQETLRMHPPVPIVLRRLAGPLTIGGVACSEGQIVGIALHALHFNPSIWPEPDRFEPKRFLTRKPTPFEYAPFGGGHRRCIGAAFAVTELAVAIGTIMGSMELRMPARERDRPPPRCIARGIAVAPAREITLEVVEPC